MTIITNDRLLPELDLSKIEIKPRHLEQGVTSDLLTRIWDVMCKTLVKAEYGNLWVKLHGNMEFSELIEGKNVKALKYLFPYMIKATNEGNYSYLDVLSSTASAVPELARRAGLTPRYMNSEDGFQCNVIRVKEGPDNWPKYRALKSSISVVPLVRDLAGKIFVVIGKNKPNGSGRPVGTITGYTEPHETFEGALRREVCEETGLVIPLEKRINMVAMTYKKDYYPGADDRNEVGAVCFDLEEDASLELKPSEDGTLKLIQHTKEGGQNELKAADDLAELYVLPYEEALKKMKPETSGYNKVVAAVEALKSGSILDSTLVTYGWKSDLQSYDDVIFTFPVTFPVQNDV